MAGPSRVTLTSYAELRAAERGISERAVADLVLESIRPGCVTTPGQRIGLSEGKESVLLPTGRMARVAC